MAGGPAVPYGSGSRKSGGNAEAGLHSAISAAVSDCGRALSYQRFDLSPGITLIRRTGASAFPALTVRGHVGDEIQTARHGGYQAIWRALLNCSESGLRCMDRNRASPFPKPWIYPTQPNRPQPNAVHRET